MADTSITHIPDMGTIKNAPISPNEPAVRGTPWTSGWWSQSNITGIPESTVGWHVAQGWGVTGVVTANNSQSFYNMSRRTIQSWTILQKLLEEYTFAYNEARSSNQNRYVEIADMMVLAVTNTREHLDKTADVSNNTIEEIVAKLDAMETTVKADAETAEAAMETASALVTANLVTYKAKYNSLQPLYDTHEATAIGLLTDLGVTELARINEQFDNLLSKLKQGMISRGLYSSLLYAPSETRVERERNEAIAALNDRLAREKLQNYHQLFEQEMALNRTILDSMSQYDALTMQNSRFMTDTYSQLINIVSNAELAGAQGLKGIRDAEDRMMMSQIDVYNDMAKTLWRFMEARTDSYPDSTQLTKLVTGLGDSGGSWISP